MHNDIEKILFSQEQLNTRIAQIGKQISSDFAGKNPVLISILRGSVIFLADLMRNIDIPMSIDFMSISSYGSSTSSSGVVKIRKDIDTEISGKDVIIIEDIVDSGLSLVYILDYLRRHNPASVSTCVLLNKPEAHKTPIEIDYEGFKIGNEFVVGYGLDYAEKYRNLAYIGILKKEVYS